MSTEPWQLHPGRFKFVGKGFKEEFTHIARGEERDEFGAEPLLDEHEDPARVAWTPGSRTARQGGRIGVKRLSVSVAFALAFGVTTAVGAADTAGAQVRDLPSAAGYRSSSVLPAGLARAERVATDPFGNIYVTDYTKDVVVQIAPSGGTRDITVAGVNFSRGIATDARGNLYVVDPTGRRVAKVTPSGAQTFLSLPGAGTQGILDAAVVDGQGNLYIGDCDSARIIKRSDAGKVTFIPAGDACYGQFDVDAAGNLYLPDGTANKVIRVDGRTGTRSTIAFSGLKWTRGVAVAPNGDIYVLDDDRVLVKTKNGQVQVDDGLTTDAFWGIDMAPDGSVIVGNDTSLVAVRSGTAARRVRTAGLGGNARPAVGPNGHVYVTDPGNAQVLDLAPDGSVSVVSLPGLRTPSAAAVGADGTLYVADGEADAILKRSPAGTVETVTMAGLGGLFDLAIDTDGSLYALIAIQDSVTTKLLKRTPAGVVSTVPMPANFWPEAMALDSEGNLYVSCVDFYCQGGVKELKKGGGVRQVLGGISPGWGRAYLALDDTGTVYVSGTGPNGSEVRRVTPSGAVSVIGGYPSKGVYPTPAAIAVDGKKNLYVFDPQFGLLRLSPTTGVPSAPAAPTVTMTGASAKVAWSAPAANGTTITGYHVLEYDLAGVAAVHPAASSARSITLPLQQGTSRRYRVLATTSGGPGPSSPSSLAAVSGFPTVAAYVDRQFSDFLGRAPTLTESLRLLQQMENLPVGWVPFSLRVSSDGAQNVDPVARLYWAYFARIPDRGGLNYWISRKRKGVSLTQISSTFAESSEFKRTYGGVTDAEYVKLVYQNVLGRSPDSGGLSYWVAKLQSKRVSRGGVMIGFSESSEYVRKKRPEVDVVTTMMSMLRQAPSGQELSSRASGLASGSTSLLDLMGDLLVDSRYPY